MSATIKDNNKRIAKNTVFMYFRMLIIMAIGIFTSRVNLSALGIADYGIYNVVGGIVAILAFLNGAMSSGTQRFLNFEIGKGHKENLNRVFSTSVIIHTGIAFIIFIIAETVGLWFLNYKMNIPQDRLVAANWVFQFSILSFMVSIVSVPYNAAIIAHEKMSAFAYIGILEVVLKLLVAYALYISPADKLITFACLNFCVVLLLRVIYQLYSRRHFEETKAVTWHVDRTKLKEMLSFSVWIIVGSLSGIFHTQGIGIVMNMFFGVTVNAAQGVANQVNSIVKQFIQNFTVALNPQIVKNYAAGNLEEMYVLLMRGCRIAFCLVAFFALPIILECPKILAIWLEEVPEYTIIFVRIIMVITLCDSFHAPLATSKNATGDIKMYQIVLTILGLAHIPLAWLFFEFGYGPEYAMYVYLFLIICMQYSRIHLVCKSIGLSKTRFFKIVICRNLAVVVASLVVPLTLHFMLPQGMVSSMLVVLISSFISVATATLFIGFDAHERKAIKGLVLSKLNKSNKI